MDIVKRARYTKKIQKYIDKPIIKVITGMRRVGKSTLLRIIKDDMLSHIPANQKIFLSFESLELISIKNALDLKNYLDEIIIDSSHKLYFFFDEIQMVEDWQRIVNGLNNDYDCDIYITGSNSTLLSGNIASLLAGRYVEFEIQSFTFSEFCSINGDANKDIDFLFDKYIKMGGLPGLKYFMLEEEPSYKYLTDVYNTVLIKDVLTFYNIRDVDLFNRILLFAMQNIGSTFSALSIKKYLKNESRDVSVDTILNYMEYCQHAFILKKVPRYDSLGKKVLRVDEKYFLSDHGFRQAMGYSNSKDIERTLENIVYIELLSRGYKVKIGRVGEAEVDFIASKQDKIEYYQVSYLMESESTRQREFGAYSLIKDNYPKFVISMDRLDFSQDGIVHKNIIVFLLEED